MLMEKDQIEGRSVFPLDKQPCFKTFESSKTGVYDNSSKYFKKFVYPRGLDYQKNKLNMYLKFNQKYDNYESLDNSGYKTRNN